MRKRAEYLYTPREADIISVLDGNGKDRHRLLLYNFVYKHAMQPGAYSSDIFSIGRTIAVYLVLLEMI